jgi:hypothetical protein
VANRPKTANSFRIVISVIASEAKQSRLNCRVAALLAMTDRQTGGVVS